MDRLLDMWKPILGSFVMSLVMIGVSLLGLPNLTTLCMQIIVGTLIYLLMSKITKDDNMDYCMSVVSEMLHKKSNS